MISLIELKKEILNSTKDIEKIKYSLKELKGNTISIGTGGSRVVAEFASKVLERKNNIIAKVIDVSDLYNSSLQLYDNIFISSYSGSNYGVKTSFIENKNIYLLSNRKTNIANENLLHYDMPKESSFISLTATIIPMSILLSYYLDDKFVIILDKIFESIDEELNLKINSNFLNIFSGSNTSSSEEFLESTLTESGLLIPLIHNKYSYCHGRSTINKDHQGYSIYLGYKGSDLDKALTCVLSSTMQDNLILKDTFKDDIVNDFYLTLQCIYLVENIASYRKINLSSVKYDKEAVRNLYYFKGSM